MPVCIARYMCSTEPQSWHFIQFWAFWTFGSHFDPLVMKTQGRFLWQNWPPGWVVSWSGVTSVIGGILLCLSKSGVEIFWPKFFLAGPKIWRGYFYICPNLVLEFFWLKFFFGQPKICQGGTFMFVQIWCQNFLANIFFGQLKISEGGTFTFVQIWCWNFLAKIFFGQPKILLGVLLCFSKNDLGIFSQLWGYQNMKTSECHETSRYAKIFDLGAFFVDHFGPQSSGWGNFGCHFDPVTPIAQGPDFYWSFIFCPSLPVPNLVLISWMM